MNFSIFLRVNSFLITVSIVGGLVQIVYLPCLFSFESVKGLIQMSNLANGC